MRVKTFSLLDGERKIILFRVGFILIHSLRSIGAAWASVGTTYCVILVMLWPMSRALHTTPRFLIDWKHVSLILLIGGGVSLLLSTLHLLLLNLPFFLGFRLIIEGSVCLLLSFLAYHWLGVCTWSDLKSFIKNMRSSSQKNKS